MQDPGTAQFARRVLDNSAESTGLTASCLACGLPHLGTAQEGPFCECDDADARPEAVAKMLDAEPKPEALLKEYPEHMKLRAISDESQAIYNFLEWCEEQGVVLARMEQMKQLHPLITNLSDL